MKKKFIIPAMLSASAMMAAVMPMSVMAATQRIAPPTDSATLLSQTYTELYDILNGKEYYVSITEEETGAVKTVAYDNGNTYIYTKDKDGKESESFVKDGSYYKVDRDKQLVTYNILNVPVQDVSIINFANLKYSSVNEEDDGYTVEQFKCGSNTEQYCFDSSNNLKQIIIEDRKGDEYTYTVTTFTDEVPSSLFTIPRGYEIKSDTYKLSDTRTMTIFADIITGDAYTMAFEKVDEKSNVTKAVTVKNGFDYYSNVTEQNVSKKELAIGPDIYDFDDANKVYTKSDRSYNALCPIYFNTAKYDLVGIDKVPEDNINYIVETFKDGTAVYDYYWDGETLAKIVTKNNSNKVLETTTFTTLSATADASAFKLPSNYTEKEGTSLDPTIDAGEQTDEGSQDITTAPQDAPIIPVETVPIVTTPEVSDETMITETPDAVPDVNVETMPETTSTPTTQDEAPQTGNASIIPAISVAIASLAALIVGKKHFSEKE